MSWSVEPYPGSRLTSSEEQAHSEFNAVVGIDPDAPEREDRLSYVTVAGHFARFAYENPRDRSIGEIAANYREALRAAGFEVVLECVDEACAPIRTGIRSLNGSRFLSARMHFLTARLRESDSDTWVQINIISARHAVRVLQTAEMDRGLVAVTAAQLEEGLLVDGRVVLDGILFDYDAATLQAESASALQTIAQFLAERPQLSVYIVGHTDGFGTFEYNLDLSGRRARAVVAALVDDYGVDRDRVAAYGVGPLAPVRSNSRDDNRALNRRVEMVER